MQFKSSSEPKFCAAMYDLIRKSFEHNQELSVLIASTFSAAGMFI